MKHSEYSTLREGIREIIVDLLSETKKSRKKRKKKPGGGLTDFGAKRHLDPGSWETEVSTILRKEEGDVADAAKTLDISKRTLYHTLQSNKKLERVRQQAIKDSDGKL